MIHKFLIIEKSVFLSSSKLDNEKGGTTIIELMIPIDVHWSIVDLLKQADYMLATNEHSAMVQGIYKQVYRQAAPYAMFESDRLWLLKNASA